MGITMSEIARLRHADVLKPGAQVLDIGSSNLYSASEDALRNFLSSFTIDTNDAEVGSFIKRLSAGSQYGPNGGLNESFVGELFERVGLGYLSFDIASGYKTTIFDLNRCSITGELRGHFDVVLNYGTTEHLLNQFNAFGVIHDATKLHGYMVHELPASGYIDHGYFTYTPRFFFDIAVANEYEIVSLEYHGPGPARSLYSIVKDYEAFFPRLSVTISSAPSELTSYLTKDIGLAVTFRKATASPFRVPMETTTSVGQIGDFGSDIPVAGQLSTLKLYRLAGSALAAAIARTPRSAVRIIRRKSGLG